MKKDNVLSVNKISKKYGKVTVVDQVSFQLPKGSIRSVVGENGAGKSTIMKMLTGVVPIDGGELLLNGKAVTPASPKEAAGLGISMVHQELQLVPELSVIDNLMLVSPPRGSHLKRGFEAEKKFVREQIAKVGLKINPHTIARRLSAAQAQLLEILKALILDSKIIILDEPTSALPPYEVDNLLSVVESLRDSGHAILYITHHLSEVTRISDYITVLRDGKLVGNFDRGELTKDEIVTLMVDRPVSLYRSKLKAPQNDIVMSVRDVATANVSGLDFDIRKGEIIGFAGLIGSGMHEAGLALCGADQIKSGIMAIKEREVKFNSPAKAVAAGIVLVPEERKTQSIVPELSVHENFHLGRGNQYSRLGFLNKRKMHHISQELVKQFDVRLNSLAQPISNLSGGNQQKVILGRCIQANPDVLILAEPTRGIDIAAKSEIHQLVIDLAAQGTSIVLISSEMEEVIALSHRIAVFCDGKMAGVLEGAEIAAPIIMKMATPKRIKELKHA